jgi:hypothetical protein
MDKRREEGIRDDGGDDEVVVVVVVEERGDGGIARVLRSLEREIQIPTLGRIQWLYITFSI